MKAKHFIYQGKKIRRVGFVGFGKSNVGVYEYLSSHYRDLKYTLRSTERPSALPKGIKRILWGELQLLEIHEDILFLSPSVRRDIPELALAAKRGVILSSDAELFFLENRSDVYAITGSDGKSTTTYLTARLLSSSYKRAIPSGNIGDPLTPHLDDGEGVAYATELSSFNLNYLKPKCRRAAITNITENHLNWHSSYEEYIAAKRAVLERADERILNFDCDICRRFMKDYKFFAIISKNKTDTYLKSQVNAEHYLTVRDEKIFIDGQPLLDTAKIAVPGEHNIYNFMSALALAYGAYSVADATALAESFAGLEHRCRLIGTFGGVKFIDSSIDSSPKRTAATLSMLTGDVTVILGGRSKGLDYSELVTPIIKKATSVIITGENRDEIEEVLLSSEEYTKANIKTVKIDGFTNAVEYSAREAVPGDTVLLSPASTSFDSFSGFEERGRVFSQIVKNIYRHSL